MFSIFAPKKSAAASVEPTSNATESGAWLSRLKSGLAKTRSVLNTDVSELFARHGSVDEALFEELETALIAADIGRV